MPSPSAIQYPEETNYPNATSQGEDNAKQNNNRKTFELFTVFTKCRKY